MFQVSHGFLQFSNSGISGVTWAADIIKDTTEEGNEKFRVLLKASTNAVLGQNDKATVTIVNLNKNGWCLLLLDRTLCFNINIIMKKKFENLINVDLIYMEDGVEVSL